MYWVSLLKKQWQAVTFKVREEERRGKRGEEREERKRETDLTQRYSIGNNVQ